MELAKETLRHCCELARFVLVAGKRWLVRRIQLPLAASVPPIRRAVNLRFGESSGTRIPEFRPIPHFLRCFVARKRHRAFRMRRSEMRAIPA